MKFPTLKSTFAQVAAVLVLCGMAGGCRSTPVKQAPIALVPPNSFVQAWAAKSDYKKVRGLYHAGDLLLVYGEDRQVTGYDTKGGLKFKVTVGRPGDVIGEPMVNSEMVILPTSSSLEIYNREGVFRRSMTLEKPIRSPGVLADNLVYLGVDTNNGGEIGAVALDRQYNLFRWTRLVGVVAYRPVFFENAIYFANEAGRVFALTTDPVVLWPGTPEMKDGTFHTDGKIDAPLRVDEGGVFVPSTDTKLYCLDAVTGRIRWTYYSGVPLHNEVQPGKDMVYTQVDGMGMVALDKKTGEPKVRQPRWNNRDAVKALSDDAQNVYVMTKGRKIAALDKKTGEARFTSARSDYVQYAENLVPKDNTIFVMTADNTLMALTPVTRPGVVGRLAQAAPSAPEQFAQR